VARFRACRVKRRSGVMMGGGGRGLVAWWQQGGCPFANARPGGGGWAKNPKSSVCGSVSGTPCEMAVWDDVGIRWVRVSGMEVVGGLRVRQRETRGIGVAHLVTWHPCCCHSSSHLFSPPSLPTPTPPWNHLPAGVSFICGQFGAGRG
jgi:hypothetical protein